MNSLPTTPFQPAVIVVTGIQAAGKSTVARMLAQRFVRGVHVEADLLHHMIVSGAEWVRTPGVPQGEAARQLRLRLTNMCLLGKSFRDAGFTVVLDDIILGERWDHLRAELADIPFLLVVLAPRAEVVSAVRDTIRGKRPVGEEWALFLDRALRDSMQGVGYWIDTSEQSPEQTVHEILHWLDEETGGAYLAPVSSEMRGTSMSGDATPPQGAECYIERFPHLLPHRLETAALRPCGHMACDPHTITYYGTGAENDEREGDYCMICYERTFPGMCPDRVLRAALAGSRDE